MLPPDERAGSSRDDSVCGGVGPRASTWLRQKRRQTAPFLRLGFLHFCPLPIHCPLGRGPLAVELAQATGLGLVAGGDGFLGTGFGVAVVGNDAGVVAAACRRCLRAAPGWWCSRRRR